MLEALHIICGTRVVCLSLSECQTKLHYILYGQQYLVWISHDSVISITYAIPGEDCTTVLLNYQCSVVVYVEKECSDWFPE